jgi:hypothetical protein
MEDAMTTEATPTALPWVVLDCFVTRILGEYATEEEATAAADKFGSCSFAYPADQLSRT